MAKVAVLVIHGMGSTAPDYADGLIRRISDQVGKLDGDPSDIAWKTVFWQDILEDRELGYLRRAQRDHNIDAIRLRHFVLTAFGDAVAYRCSPGSSNTTYDKIHNRIWEKITDLYEGAVEGEDKTPLVVMAHSLGCHMMSNYIWDIQHPREDDKGWVAELSPFEGMQTLAGMITFGCNIPLFTFAYRRIVPITFPAKELPISIRDKAKWLNFYDPDDVLGYPLKPINKAYDAVVTADIDINVGGIFTNWNPVSHNKYWEDNSMAKPVAEFLRTFL